MLRSTARFIIDYTIGTVIVLARVAAAAAERRGGRSP
jgi:hypothetical protein